MANDMHNIIAAVIDYLWIIVPSIVFQSFADLS